LIQKIDDIGNINRRPGSGRQRSARALLMLNVRGAGAESGGAPQTHSSQRQIARQLGVPVASVNRIVEKDLQLQCLRRRRTHELTESNKKTRLSCATETIQHWHGEFCLHHRRKAVHIVAPSNTQNEGDYASSGVRKSTSYRPLATTSPDV